MRNWARTAKHRLSLGLPSAEQSAQIMEACTVQSPVRSAALDRTRAPDQHLRALPPARRH